MGRGERTRLCMHPISLNTVIDPVSQRVLGLRVTGIPTSSDTVQLVYDWFAFLKQSGIPAGYSYTYEVLSGFCSRFYHKLLSIDIYGSNIGAILNLFRVQFDTIIPVPRSFSNELMIVKAVSGSESSNCFVEYMSLLFPQSGMDNQFVQPKKLLGSALYAREVTDRLIMLGYSYSNVCYLSSSVYKKLKGGSYNRDSGIYQFTTCKQGYLLCEGRVRHIPVNIGVCLTFNTNVNMVTLYTGTLSNGTFIAVNRTFDNNVFDWVKNNCEVVKNVCGIKY